jgi:hypothetical protein
MVNQNKKRRPKIHFLVTFGELTLILTKVLWQKTPVVGRQIVILHSATHVKNDRTYLRFQSFLFFLPKKCRYFWRNFLGIEKSSKKETSFCHVTFSDPEKKDLQQSLINDQISPECEKGMLKCAHVG